MKNLSLLVVLMAVMGGVVEVSISRPMMILVRWLITVIPVDSVRNVVRMALVRTVQVVVVRTLS